MLFVTHALVGAVELGTDGWIQNITGNILTPAQGKILFVFTSLLMFSLRFCADFIEKNLKLSPIGLLFALRRAGRASACTWSAASTTFAGAMLALAVYAVGKTFFWPTMLAVVGDRFPRTGAVAISIMGGIGMMSAGLIGGPASATPRTASPPSTCRRPTPALYEQYKAPNREPLPVPRGGARARRHQAVEAQKPRRRRPPTSRPSPTPASSAIARR